MTDKEQSLQEQAWKRNGSEDMKKFDIKMKKRIAYLGAALAVQFGVLPWSVEAAVANDALPKDATVHGTTVKVNGVDTVVPDAHFLNKNSNGKYSRVNYADFVAETKDGKTIMNIEQDAKVRTGLINWDSFNIGKDAMVNITQHRASDILINNVKGNNMSEIYGAINATGNVVLINPNGIVFDGAKINVGGFIASTAPMKNEPDIESTAAISFSLSQNSNTQGNIDVKNTLIRAGYSAVLANSNTLALPDDFAYNLSGINNNIRLMADGDVNLQNAKLVATDSGTERGTRTAGIEEWTLAESSNGYAGSIIIRTDVNSDDYGSLNIVAPTAGTNEENWLIAPNVEAYYNPDLARDTNGKQVLGVTDDGKIYTKKDYKQEINFNDPTKVKTSVTAVTDAAAEAVGIGDKIVLKGRHFNIKDGKVVDANDQELTKEEIIDLPKTQNGGGSFNAFMLVNNIAQLQDIDDPKYGNLKGKYALGRNIDATSDELTYVEEVRLDSDNATKYVHKKDANGNAIISVSDGYFTKDTTGGTFIKHLNDGTTIGFSKSSGQYTVTATNKAGNETVEVLNATTEDGSDSYTIAGLEKVDSATVKQAVIGEKLFVKEGVAVSYVNINEDGSRNTASKVSMEAADGKVFENTWNFTGKEDIPDETKPIYAEDPETHEMEIIGYESKGTLYTYKSGSDTLTVEKIGDVITSKLGEATITDELVRGRINAAIEADPSVGSSITGTPIDGVTKVVSMKNSSNENVEYRYYNTKENVTVVDYKGSDLGAEAVEVLESNINNITATKADHKAGTPIQVQALDGAGVVTYTFNQDGSVTGKVGEQTVIAKDSHLTNAASNLLNYSAVYAQINDIDNASNTVPAVKFNGESTQASRGNVFDGSSTTDSSTWWVDSTTATAKGFNPIGKRTTSYDSDDSENKFTGTLTGTNGLNGVGGSSSISNLTINRQNESDVGLISVMKNASVNHISFDNSNVNGLGNVGAVAGKMEGSSHIGSVSVRGRVNGGAEATQENKASNIGGLVGEMVGTASIGWSSNSATVTGKCKDDSASEQNPDVFNVGGLVGKIQGTETSPMATSKDNPSISRSNNYGNVIGEESVGGIAGYAENAIIGGDTGEYVLTRVSNNANIEGKNKVGGIVGEAHGNIKIANVFNTNQNGTPADGSVIAGTKADIDAAMGQVNDKGAIKGDEYVGGIIGYMEGNDNSISQVYNAANIYGTTNVGGIAGNLTGNSTIKNSYNADNNTVIREWFPELYYNKDAAKDKGQYVPGNATSPDSTDYKLDQLLEQARLYDVEGNLTSVSGKPSVLSYYYPNPESEESVKTANDIKQLMQYYSFFTVDENGNRQYYYYVPAQVANDESRRGAAGVYVTKEAGTGSVGERYVALTAVQLDEINLSDRYYANREAFRDANVTGVSNVGGLVGKQEGGTIDVAYNAGSLKLKTGATSFENAGGLVGYQAETVTTDNIKNSFYVKGTDLSTGKGFSDAAFIGTTNELTAIGKRGAAAVPDGSGDVKGVDIKAARGGESLKAALNNSNVANRYYDTASSLDSKGNKIYVVDNKNIQFNDAQDKTAAISAKANELGISNAVLYKEQGDSSTKYYVVIPAGTKDNNGKVSTDDVVVDYDTFIAQTEPLVWVSAKEKVGDEYFPDTTLQTPYDELGVLDQYGHMTYEVITSSGTEETREKIVFANSDNKIRATVKEKLDSLGVGVGWDLYKTTDSETTSYYVVLPEGVKGNDESELTGNYIISWADLQNMSGKLSWQHEEVKRDVTEAPAAVRTPFAETAIVSNQSDVWTVYGDQSLPLLNVFMGPAGLVREFEYDGSVHNLVTDDVTGLYGRADFTDGAGKDVYTVGYENLAANGISSTYYFSKSSIWAPQHGMRINPATNVVITPTDLKIEISGGKTYGEVTQAQDVFVRDENASNSSVQVWKGTKTNYVITITGGKEGVLPAAAIINLADLSSGIFDPHNVVIGNKLTDGDDNIDDARQKLDANGYNNAGLVINAGEKIANTIADSGDAGLNLVYVNNLNDRIAQDKRNYNITLTSKYNVGKADLFYTYDGERDYGQANASGSQTYTLVGADQNSIVFTYLDSTTGEYSSTLGGTSGVAVNGFLKSFDIEKLIADGALADDGQTLNIKLNDLSNMKGYMPSDSESDAKLITPGTDGTYYHVIVGADGKVTKYIVSSLDSSKNNGSPSGSNFVGVGDASIAYLNKNYNLVWQKGEENKTFTGVEANAANNGLYAADATITVNNSTQQIDPIRMDVKVDGEKNYTQNMSNNYVVNTNAADGSWKVTLSNFASIDSSRLRTLVNEPVLKALLATINNGSTYSATKLNDYTYVKRETDGTVTVYDLKAGQELSGSLFDVAKVMTLSEGVLSVSDQVYYQVGRNTDNTENRGKTEFKYGEAGTGFLSDANKYDYLITNTSNTLKVKPLSITVDIIGEKTYGQVTNQDFSSSYDGTDAYTVKVGNNEDYKVYKDGVASSLKDALNVKNTATAQTDAKTSYDDKIAINSENGSYAVTGKQKESDVGSATYSQSDFANNYTVTINDTYTIKKRGIDLTATGERVYGGSVAADGYSYIGSLADTTGGDETRIGSKTGIMSWDAASYVDSNGKLQESAKAGLTTEDNTSAYLDVKYNANGEYDKYTSSSSSDTLASSMRGDYLESSVTTEANDFWKNYQLVGYTDELTLKRKAATITINKTVTYGDNKKVEGADITADASGFVSADITYDGFLQNDVPVTSDLKINNTLVDGGTDAPYNTDKYLDVGAYTGSNTVSYVSDSNGVIVKTVVDNGAKINDVATTDNNGQALNIDTDSLIQISEKDAGSTGTAVSEKFNAANYDITTAYTYTVTPKEIDLAVTGGKTYGQYTATAGSNYDLDAGYIYVVGEDGKFTKQVSEGKGLVENETITAPAIVYNKAHDNDAATGYGQVVYGDTIDVSNSKYLNAGTYDGSKAAGSTASELAVYVNENALTGTNGFKASNYTINQTSQYTVGKKGITVNIIGNKIYGEDTGSTGSATTSYGASEGSTTNQYTFEISGLVNGEMIGTSMSGNETLASGTISGLQLDTTKLDDGDGTYNGIDYGKGTYLDVIVNGYDDKNKRYNIGSYTSANDKGIGVTVEQLAAADKNGEVAGDFLAGNYNITEVASSYTVHQAQATVNIGGRKTYGQKDDEIIYGYEISGFANSTEKVNDENRLDNVIAYDKINTSQLDDGDAGIYGSGIYLDVGTYDAGNGRITVDDSALREKIGTNIETGFKQTNYLFGQASVLDVVAKKINIDISGEKIYGNTTATNGEGYTITITDPLATDDTASAYVLVKNEEIGALKEGNLSVAAGINNGNDSVNIRNTSVDGQNDGYDAEKDILHRSEYLDVGNYGTAGTDGGILNIRNLSDFAIVDENGNLTTEAVSQQKVFKAGNYDITYTSKYDVTPKAITVTTTASKDYGDENPANKDISYAAPDMLADDVKAAHLNNDYTDTKPTVDHTTKYTDAGKYGTVNDGNKVLETTVVDSVAKNYDITYADDLTINRVDLDIVITGSKTYGEKDATDSSGYKIEASGLKNGEALEEKAKASITNDVHDGDAGIYAINTYLDAGTYISAYNHDSKLYTVTKEYPNGNKTTTTYTEAELKDTIFINNWEALSTPDSEKLEGFNANNYNIHTTYDYTVNKAKLNADIVGEKTYGDQTSTSGNDYKITISGLENGEDIGGIADGEQGKLPNVVIDNKLSPQGTYLNVKVDANGNVIAYEDVLTVRASELGKYDSADTNGFKIDNYELTSQGDYTVNRRLAYVDITGSKIFGTDTSTDGKDYNIYINGLVNGDKVGGLGNHTGIGTGATVYHYGDTAIDSTGGKNLPVGSYFNTITLDGIEIVNGVYRTQNYIINNTSTYRVDPNKDPEAEANHTLGHDGDRKPVMLDIVYLDVQGSGIAVDMSNLSVPTVDVQAVAPVELPAATASAENANVALEAPAKLVATQAADAENTVSDEEEQRRKKAAR